MPISFYRPTSQGSGCLHMATSPLRLCTPFPPGIAIGALNIQDGRGRGLAQAIREVDRGGLDLMALADTIRV